MNEGKYILTQVTNLIPRQIFLRLVKKYNGDYRVREFNCTNQLQHLFFGQLTSCESLRDICLCLKQHNDILYGLGIKTSVNESSLSRANESRDCRIYEGLGLASSRLFARCMPKCVLSTLFLRIMISLPLILPENPALL